ncbi:MAG TPA: glycoside hydrolase family 2 TIM barrel-domain containing protein [Verrucomicrobiae bacterium]|nr:glycoside hydrolase family 2 TIM barrel-domain containing protein [Verrucomicrobiae bacterium]
MRKNAILSLAFLVLLAFPVRAEREMRELATGWRFIRQDAGLDADSTGWQQITIPHTWNAFDGQDGPAPGCDRKLNVKCANYFRGACWYARSLDIPAEWKGKRVFLRFEAAATVAKVYLNGELLGEHRGAFTAFCFELTPHVKWGQKNDLRVQVDNSHFDDVAPLAGDFNMDGGIYRPVWLIVTDPACITPLDHSSPGVYVTLKSIKNNVATLEVKSLISNGQNSSTNLEVVTELKEADGKMVASLTNQIEVAFGATAPVIQTFTIPHPHLWRGLNDPYLYSVTVQTQRNGKPVDEVVQPVGLRTVEISAEKGFLLNGNPYPIYGVSRHQDKRDKGWALSATDEEGDVRLILEMGATAIRFAHYPQNTHLHDLCDRAGLLVWDEVPLVNQLPRLADPMATPGGEVTPYFESNLEQQMREMILQLGNHPSVAWWGLFNELGRTNAVAALPLVERLNRLAHSLDPTRITVAASNKTGLPVNHIADATCYNVYPGWYGGIAEDMTKLIEERFAEQAQRRMGISEYGAGGNPFQHQEGILKKPVWQGDWHPEEWQSLVHEHDWAAMKNNPKLWGTFLWTMFDFAADWRNEGDQPGLNDKGMVRQDRKLKKDVYYFYQANWSRKPMVYIAERRLTPRRTAKTEVKVYSNCKEVELIVNGKSLGKLGPDAINTLRWKNVTLKSGANQIVAIGKDGKQQCEDECEWILETDAPSGP